MNRNVGQIKDMSKHLHLNNFAMRCFQLKRLLHRSSVRVLGRSQWEITAIDRSVTQFLSSVVWLDASSVPSDLLTLPVVAVSVSAMFKAELRMPTEAPGAKAAAEPTRSDAIASFMV